MQTKYAIILIDGAADEPVEALEGRTPLEAAVIPHIDGIVGGEMSDFTAGHITTPEAEQIIASLNHAFGEEGVRFHAGISYRHLMVISDPTMLDAVCMPPHDIPGEAVREYLPKGAAGRRIREIMERAQEIVAGHDVNLVREDLGEVPATGIWLWGQGVMPILHRFRQRYGVRGAVIAAVDLIRGLG